MNLPDPVYEIEQEVDKNGEPRHYTIDGERVPSVTTAIGVLEKPGLIAWAWNVAVEGASEVVRSALPADDPQLMRRALVDKEYGWWQVRDTAALRGNNLHEALNHLIAHGTVPSLGDFPEEQHGYVQALAAWWIETEPEVVASEIKVGSREHGFAGRLDIVRDAGGLLTLSDIKSSKLDAKTGEVRWPYPEHHFQVGGGYRLGFSETYFLDTEAPNLGAEVVNIGPDGTYRVTPAFATTYDFVAVLEVYNRMKRIKDEQANFKKAEKQRLKAEAESGQEAMSV